MTSTKKKRVSKKSKLSWRKHVNIDDVEDFLEDKRLEEQFGPPLAVLRDDELFQVDTKPNETIISGKKKRKLKALEAPKCFALLQPHTKVPDPIVKRNRVRSNEERKNELVKLKERSRFENGILRAREKQALQDRELNLQHKNRQFKRGKFQEDVWAESEKLDIEKDEWINEHTKRHNLTATGQMRKTVANPIPLKTSVLPSVTLPHPGMSYNPSFEDHQSLIAEVADKELKLMKTEEHLNRVTRNMFRKVAAHTRDSAWLEEMSEGLNADKDDNPEGSDDQYRTINPPVENKKKSLKQKRKQREQKQLELLKRSHKIQKKKVSDLHRLKQLKRVIEKKETNSLLVREKRIKSKQLKEKEPKRLGRLKFEEQDLEFNLGSEIPGNLRNIRKEGNLLNDRYKSLQRRNIVQPSIRAHKKKAKVKVYTKPGHKEDWIKTVATRCNTTPSKV